MILSDFIGYLEGALGVHVSTHVPKDRPAECVTLVAAGGTSDRFIERPSIYAHAYAETEAAALALIERVKAAMYEAPEHMPSVIAVDGANATENSLNPPPFRYSCLFYVIANK